MNIQDKIKNGNIIIKFHNNKINNIFFFSSVISIKLEVMMML